MKLKAKFENAEKNLSLNVDREVFLSVVKEDLNQINLEFFCFDTKKAIQILSDDQNLRKFFQTLNEFSGIVIENWCGVFQHADDIIIHLEGRINPLLIEKNLLDHYLKQFENLYNIKNITLDVNEDKKINFKMSCYYVANTLSIEGSEKSTTKRKSFLDVAV